MFAGVQVWAGVGADLGLNLRCRGTQSKPNRHETATAHRNARKMPAKRCAGGERVKIMPRETRADLFLRFFRPVRVRKKSYALFAPKKSKKLSCLYFPDVGEKLEF